MAGFPQIKKCPRISSGIYVTYTANILHSSAHCGTISNAPSLLLYNSGGQFRILQHLQSKPFRMPVQWVNRPDLDFLGFAGQIASGTIQPGDKIRILPSGKESTVDNIVTCNGELEQAIAGQSVTITLTDEIDISRGDTISSAAEPGSIVQQFETTIIWRFTNLFGVSARDDSLPLPIK